MAQLYKTETGHMFHAGDIAIITVGLPARGKTYLAHKLCRYLRWLGIPTAIFSVGDYRRRHIGTKMSFDFFTSPETLDARVKVANYALEDLIKFLKYEKGQVGIYDASNTEKERREFILKRLEEENIQVLFIEAICDNMEIINENIRQVKLSSPDYLGMQPDTAVADFLKRIDCYKPKYETIEDNSLSYIKDFNVGETIMVNRVSGYLPTRIVYYLMNLHIIPRRIYLTCHGETINEKQLRKDAPLSPNGLHYARDLPKYLNQLLQARDPGNQRTLKVWTSPRQRSQGTASYFQSFYEFPFSVQMKPSLVEMNPGVIDGLTEQQIKSEFPEDYQMHLNDPYNHRYPRAESYHDLSLRLEDVLLEIEREKDDVLIIANVSVLKCIYAYLLDREENEIPTLEIPKGVLIELIPVAYGCQERKYTISDFVK